jgi:hypothetical protein
MSIYDMMLSPAKIYEGTLGSALPADSLALDAAWPTGWTFVGETTSELTVDYSFDTLQFEIERAMGAVKSCKISEKLSLETTLGEATLANISLGFGGNAPTITAAASGQVGKEELKMGGSSKIPQHMWGFEGHWEDSGGVIRPIRFVIYIGQADAGGQLKFSKKTPVGIPLKIVGMEDMSKPEGERMFFLRRNLADALA